MYGKTKEAFGWPEDPEEVYQQTSGASSSLSSTSAASVDAASSNSLGGAAAARDVAPNAAADLGGGGGVESTAELWTAAALQLSHLSLTDRLATGILESLECSISLAPENMPESFVADALGACSFLLPLPLPQTVTNLNRCLMATLHANKADFFVYHVSQIS